jgi:hypothetical protein
VSTFVASLVLLSDIILLAFAVFALEVDEGDEICFGDFCVFEFLIFSVVALAALGFVPFNDPLLGDNDFFEDFSTDFTIGLLSVDLLLALLDEVSSDNILVFTTDARTLLEFVICEAFGGFIVLLRLAGPLLLTLLFFLSRVIFVLILAGFLTTFRGILAPFFLFTTIFDEITFTNLHKK